MADAPSRYRNSAVVGTGTQLYLGRRVLPNTAPRGDDQFIPVQFGDNLQLIAFRQFGDMRLWWVVADFNDIVDPTVDLEVGSTLRVPSRSRLWLSVLK